MSKLVDADGGGGFRLRDAAAGGDAAAVDLAHPDTIEAEDGARRPARVRLAVPGLGAALLRLQQGAAAPARRRGRGGERHQQQRGERREGLHGARHDRELEAKLSFAYESWSISWCSFACLYRREVRPD
jgi:hypothetical protein